LGTDDNCRATQVGASPERTSAFAPAMRTAYLRAFAPAVRTAYLRAFGPAVRTAYLRIRTAARETTFLPLLLWPCGLRSGWALRFRFCSVALDAQADAAGGEPRDRVDFVDAVEPDLEMDVGTGG